MEWACIQLQITRYITYNPNKAKDKGESLGEVYIRSGKILQLPLNSLSNE